MTEAPAYGEYYKIWILVAYVVLDMVVLRDHCWKPIHVPSYCGSNTREFIYCVSIHLQLSVLIRGVVTMLTFCFHIHHCLPIEMEFNNVDSLSLQ